MESVTPPDNVENLCFRVSLAGMYLTQAIEFQSVHGEKVTLDILRGIKKAVEHRRANGLPSVSSITLWKEAIEKYVAAKDSRAGSKAEQGERDKAEKAYLKTKEKGYLPTQKKIREQLDDLINKGNISVEEYDVAIRSGLVCVHDMTGISEPAEEAFDINF